MLEIGLVLLVVCLLPAFTWIADGFYGKNVPRGLVQFVMFVFSVLACILLLKIAKMAFVVAVPLLILPLVLFGGKRKKK